MSSRQDNTEALLFKIGLSGTYWGKKPAYSILINGVEYASGTITAESGVVEYCEFLLDLVDDQDYTLEIKLTNKTNDDVVKDPPTGEPYTIIKDLLLNIESIDIDGISLGNLLWTHSDFIADDDARPNLPGCVNLGWNGTYTLKFTTPFYLWLLENM